VSSAAVGGAAETSGAGNATAPAKSAVAAMNVLILIFSALFHVVAPV
jgi:hypothetical protein